MLKNPELAAEVVVYLKLPSVDRNKKLRGQVVEVPLLKTATFAELRASVGKQFRIDGASVVLKRKGGAGFDDARTPKSYGLRSGDHLYLSIAK